MSEPIYKKKEIPRLAPGTRVKITPCRWWFKTGHGYEKAPSEDWGEPYSGTVIAPEYWPGWHYGPDHAWGIRDWETVIDLDRPRGHYRTIRVIKYPTAILEVIDYPILTQRLEQVAFQF